MALFFSEWIGQIPYLDNKYLAALAIILFFIILARLVLLFFSFYLKRIAGKTETKIDDLIFDYTRKPLFYFVLVYGFKLALMHLEIDGIMTSVVNTAMAVVFLYILTRVLDVIIEGWGTTFAEKTETKIDEVLLPLFHKAAKVVFVIVGFMWILHIWGVDITPYLAGVGISGIVLGLALQDSLKNVFGGINLLLDKTYLIGDKIKLENGEVGKISEIGLRSTKIVTFDNEVLYVPNGYLANAQVKNYARPDNKVRVKVEFGVEYGSDVTKVKKVVLDAVTKIEGVLNEPAATVNFLEMGDYALKFRASFWVKHWDQGFSKKAEATTAIYNVLNKKKIGIPFPTQIVHIKK